MSLPVAVLSLISNSSEGYLLTPWLSGRASGMNAVEVLVGVLCWGWLWGDWGLLLGRISILITIKSVCDHVDEFKPIGEFLGN